MAVARVEFLNLGAIDILDWIILRGGGGGGWGAVLCIGGCNSIPGLDPPDASSTVPVITIKKVSRDPLRGTIAPS